MQTGENFLGWCVAISYSFSIIYLLWKSMSDRSLFSLHGLLSLPPIFAFSWFMLWVTTGLVPYGLWALFGSLAYLFLVLVVEFACKSDPFQKVK